MPDGPLIRRGLDADLAKVAEIQAGAPEASQWNVREYLEYDFRVIEAEGRLAGFSVARPLAGGECELLNLAVAVELRRRGLATRLLQDLCARCAASVYLEVRVSNEAAIGLYKAFGFQEVGRRAAYYEHPPEAAVVMKYCSCYCHK